MNIDERAAIQLDATVTDAPLRVAFETTALDLDHGGTARMINRLRSQLEDDPRVALTTVAQPGNGHGVARGLVRELAYFPRQLPKLVERSTAELLHCPAAVAPGRCRVPTVITIHDAIAWQHPEWLGRVNVFHQRTRVKPALLRAARVITSSEFSRRDLVERVGLDPDRVIVIPLAADRRFAPGDVSPEELRQLGIKGRYLLTVGTLQPRKNLETAIAAFEQLGRDGEDLQLVIAGARGWRDNQLIKRIDESSSSDRIVLAGHLSDDQLLQVYRGAAVFVFPSRYEGFGLPVLEAMAAGVPVVSSNASSMPEVVTDAGIMVDPDDIDAFADAIVTLLQDVARRDELVEMGIRRAASFSWQQVADQNIAVYQSVV